MNLCGVAEIESLRRPHLRGQSCSIAGDRIEQLRVNAQAQHMTLVSPRAGAMVRSRHDAPAFVGTQQHYTKDIENAFE
jgi:hypothetical protein